MLVLGNNIFTSADLEEIRGGAFRVTDCIISEIGKWDYLKSKYHDDHVVGGKNIIIILGLVNVHGHVSESRITGIVGE